MALVADAMIVSNHGGRQLDGAMGSIEALPSIPEAVGDTTEVHLDGGVRSGQEILKAVAMGAQGTISAALYLWFGSLRRKRSYVGFRANTE